MTQLLFISCFSILKENIKFTLGCTCSASATTFSRFIPSVKQLFDYGAMIFILTFSLVAFSGYRVDELFELAHQRLATIIIGTSLCILVSMLIWPIWAGQELFALINGNMDKLANSLEGKCLGRYTFQSEMKIFASFTEEFPISGYVAEYFNPDDSNKNLLAYKCVLNSKASEESMVR